MAAIMSIAYPEPCAATGIASGLPCGSATDFVSAFAAMRRALRPTAPAKKMGRIDGALGCVRTIVFHGVSSQTDASVKR